jgi:ribonuclease Z
LEAMELDHGIPTLGYNFLEKDKRRIDLKKTKKEGIPEGPLLGQLQNSKTIEFKGKRISPEEMTYLVKGKKVTVVADTATCKNCYSLANEADLLICEATFSSKLEEKGEEYGHMTAKQAALIANKANVKHLILNHLSARYKTPNEILNEAQTYFTDSRVAEDFMKIKL